MIEIKLHPKNYQPGEKISGQLRWFELSHCNELHVRLIWYTAGKGDLDFAIVAQQVIAYPPATGESEISFIAPRWPHSFSGKLITLTWAIEVVQKPNNQSARTDIVIGPGREEVSLTATEA